jgi:hypothetical protein
MDYETKKISRCCGADVYELDDKDPQGHEHGCDKCERGCEFDEVCELCDGTGETDAMESVYPGEAHQALTGTQKCICQFHEDDGNDYD